MLIIPVQHLWCRVLGEVLVGWRGAFGVLLWVWFMVFLLVTPGTVIWKKQLSFQHYTNLPFGRVT